MFDYLYLNGEITCLMAGDIIKWAPDKKQLTFFRNDIQLQIRNRRDDAVSDFDQLTFLSTIALATGLEPVQSSKYTRWELVKKQ